ncbi:MAG TPA: type VII secretion-associated protein, partial [Mycobacterium sp.]|nr:type VII secretion-associated protein [Mycobacterium sp.]
VAEVWSTVIRDAVGGPVDAIAVVCPTWWPSSRLDRIYDAALTVADDVLVLTRAQVLCDRSIVVEIAPEFIVVSRPGGDVHVVARDDSDALVTTLPASAAVLLDRPDGVAGACALASTIADRLRAKGIAVTIADRDAVARNATTMRAPQQGPSPQTCPPTKHGRHATAVLAGTVLSAAVLCGGFAARQDMHPSAADVPMTLLVERRVGLMVPAQWAVQRVVSGPGSARVQVVSPNDSGIALHVTQSSLPPQPSVEQVAASVRDALEAEPDGVFVDFNPADRRADRPVVTYRELRADHHVAWFVLIDRAVRIAIGCQSPPAREDAVREACDQAIRTAHAVF